MAQSPVLVAGAGAFQRLVQCRFYPRGAGWDRGAGAAALLSGAPVGSSTGTLVGWRTHHPHGVGGAHPGHRWGRGDAVGSRHWPALAARAQRLAGTLQRLHIRPEQRAGATAAKRIDRGEDNDCLAGCGGYCFAVAGVKRGRTARSAQRRLVGGRGIGTVWYDVDDLIIAVWRHPSADPTLFDHPAVRTGRGGTECLLVGGRAVAWQGVAGWGTHRRSGLRFGAPQPRVRKLAVQIAMDGVGETLKLRRTAERLVFVIRDVEDVLGPRPEGGDFGVFQAHATLGERLAHR